MTSVAVQKKRYPPPIPGSPEWDANRLLSVGASEVAALLLPSAQRSPLSLWLAKTGQTTRSPEDPKGPQAAGRYFERALAQWYCDTSPDVRDWRQSYVEHDADVPELSASPDYDILTEEKGERSRILECKIRSGVPRGWGDEGTDQIPLDVLVQVHAQLTVTGLPFADVAAFLGGIGLRVYRVHADDGLQVRIREVVRAFWSQYVAPRKEPPIVGIGADEYVTRKHLRATSEVVRAATPDENDLLAELAKVRAAHDDAKLSKEQVEARVKDAIAENRGLEGDAGRALWSNVTKAAAVNWEAIARNLAASVPDGPDILARQLSAHAETPTSYRRFVFTTPKER